MLIASRVFWCALVSGITFLLFFIFYRKFFLEKGHMIHKVMLALYSLYLGLLFVLILFPTYMLKPFRFSTTRVNLVPFMAVNRLLVNPLELVGNLLLFVPFGFFSVLNDHKKAGLRLVNVLWRTMVFSTIMELLQMFVGRVTDIDDVILNTLSGLIGGALCVVWHKTRLDHTAFGEKVMPELPKRWRGKMAVPLISVAMLIFYGVSLCTVNAFATRYNGKQYEATINGKQTRVVIEAENAMLWDRAEEKTLFAANTDAPIYPASTIKLAMCLTVMDIAAPEEEVTVGSEILLTPMDCSNANIRMGTTYTVRELLGAVLLPSGADASYTLSAYCGRLLLDNPSATVDEAISAFLAAVNAKLQGLGAVHTTMRNIHGLDDKEQLTTAEDLCRIAAATLDQPVLAALCATPEMDIGPEDARLHLVNTNMLLRSDTPFYSADFIGIKTGSTSRAGNCLIAAFQHDDKQYISIVMHSGYDGKFTDTLALADLVRTKK